MRPIFFYTGVFLISCSTLMLEIIQTRILSVVVWYHLLASISAIAVSLALGIKATLIVGALCYFLLIPVSLALVQQSNRSNFLKSRLARQRLT
jgi:hypothetical protein